MVVNTETDTIISKLYHYFNQHYFQKISDPSKLTDLAIFKELNTIFQSAEQSATQSALFQVTVQNPSLPEDHPEAEMVYYTLCEHQSVSHTKSESQNFAEVTSKRLDYELLKNPNCRGLYNLNSNPSLEFVGRGSLANMRELLSELMQMLGFQAPKTLLYEDMCARYQCTLLGPVHELLMQQEFGNVLSLEIFPERTWPFWNTRCQENEIKYHVGSMEQQREAIKYQNLQEQVEKIKQDGNAFVCLQDKSYNQMEILLYGKRAVVSSERCTDPKSLEERFYRYADRIYSLSLFNQYGKDKINQELENFLALPMEPYFGGTIHLNVLMRAMRFANLLNNNQKIELYNDKKIMQNSYITN